MNNGENLRHPPREFPFPAYPNGWFAACYADEIAVGEVKPLVYFGRDLVVWRDLSAGAHVFDAHCAHLGAHLGYGGRVENDCLRCPFHAWGYRSDGVCVDIPYAEFIPPKAVVKSYPVREIAGIVFFWFHAEAKPPSFEIADLPEYADANWSDYTKAKWMIKSRMYDMGENPVDLQHFKYLHGGVAPTLEQYIMEHGGTKNVSSLDMVTPHGNVSGSITSEDFGPGLVIVHVKGIVHTIIVLTNVPVDENVVEARFGYLQPKTDDPNLQYVGQKLIEELKRQMDQDIVIFEHKKHLRHPCLVKEDGPIRDYRLRARKYYSGQFYDE